MEIAALWQELLAPLLRMLCGLAFGLLIANVLEALRWTEQIAKLARPLARAAHLRDVAGASFALSFVSAASANALLGESLSKGELSRKEVLLANLFNALPAYLLHTPTIFFLTFPVLGFPAVIYVGLTLFAAALRTGLTLFAARLLLPVPQAALPPVPTAAPAQRWRTAMLKAWTRFCRRLPKLIYFTVPMYILMVVLHRLGFFELAQAWLAQHAAWLAFIKPEAMGIIVLHLAAELGAALGAAGAIMINGSVQASDVVLALLVGNILSTPMRALRHQLPAYAAFYSPKTALLLIVANQGLRALSLLLVSYSYYWYCQ